METVPAPLKGKVAVVTGGSRGIGAATTRIFAQQGCTHLAITYYTNKDKAEEVLATVREINSKIKTCAIAVDVLDPEIGPKVVKQALEGLGTDHIDILVSNAASVDAVNFPPVAQITKEQWDDLITGNAWAPLSLAKEVINCMPRGGRIIMVSNSMEDTSASCGQTLQFRLKEWQSNEFTLRGQLMRCSKHLASRHGAVHTA